ncbi:O-methyltransferase [Oceanirhabdus sp. W0125-5]|uniref:O-methyltransferase n=1 Tax=Oceanirhabdus sp. W0125-5 TaxID=2999116 RepID=UPI0022F2D08F|nr:O-methyltransferase [Oceanirhabdus sp. W0125-5]WBW99615.1 O-methyltransferase [Oceanirhabdus sp. W0125-5]
MSGIAHDYMEKYLRNLIEENDEPLKGMEEYSEENHVPIVQQEVANFLKVMVTMKKPKKILELGTAIGYSSILMCKELNKQCEIVTIDRNDEMVKIAQENIEKYGYSENITIIHEECLEALEKLSESQKGEYDFIFMDAGKGHYNHFLPFCLELLKDDGIIISDNVLFRGMVATDDLVKRRKITIVKRMRKYLEMISKDKNLLTTIIPMGDGIAITTRRDSSV